MTATLPRVGVCSEPITLAVRQLTNTWEPVAQRTYTSSQSINSTADGIYFWTPEGRRLFDFTSGVLVANLGHNPPAWTAALHRYMGWTAGQPAIPINAYNAITCLEATATAELQHFISAQPGGESLQQVLWAASGSEAVQKALWVALAQNPQRNLILATRYGFHGKKGLSGAVSGCETDKERDPRVRFIPFPMAESKDISQRDQPIDLTRYQTELEDLISQEHNRFCVLITEPYLGGGGSYHPPAAYLQMLQTVCRKHNILFVLDEVQANFGRTRELFAFSTYGLAPDLVVLGKGLGNGVPVAAVVGRREVMNALVYGDASDTWSANPLSCAAVLATLEQYADPNLRRQRHQVSRIIEAQLLKLKQLPFIAAVRGEAEGMVWGIECGPYRERTAAEWANDIVLACYRGKNQQGIHLLGPLAKSVLRVSPPLTMTPLEAYISMQLLQDIAQSLV
jgi:4-aminobutyrate aminotransferase-like enzyme